MLHIGLLLPLALGITVGIAGSAGAAGVDTEVGSGGGTGCACADCARRANIEATMITVVQSVTSTPRRNMLTSRIRPSSLKTIRIGQKMILIVCTTSSGTAAE